MDNKTVVDQKVQTLLNLLDRDGNGVITREDLNRSVLEQAGTMLAELDYLVAKVKVLARDVYERNRFTAAVLSHCDADNNGRVSRAEIEAAVRSGKLDVFQTNH